VDVDVDDDEVVNVNVSASCLHRKFFFCYSTVTTGMESDSRVRRGVELETLGSVKNEVRWLARRGWRTLVVKTNRLDDG